ncbi:toll/interleukin-1 receptor domain-containing protein [Leptolyngbya sp. BC1307]|uniref:toll/interleukin-1 receptor domain-containing protein n=1 Tax=Leptolyngbya sp. BC1307 TaxID=2029589 RepID=UPI000EFC03E6|nr:toll/interleukin-1 receptor domain-containing protein [Leptolyngbya sp. BC1307]
MTQVFLSYARADGANAAARLRTELNRSGFTVWQDIENMQGGQAWKEQLRAAIRQVDAVLVLLTPSAADSQYVAWEWEMAQMVEKPVLPLRVAESAIPEELSRLHYHDLTAESDYTLGLMSLVRDLHQIGSDKPSSVELGQMAGRGDRHISIGGSAHNSQIVVGDGNSATQTNQHYPR